MCCTVFVKQYSNAGIMIIVARNIPRKPSNIGKIGVLETWDKLVLFKSR